MPKNESLNNLTPYKSYIYSYPHKKSYREFEKPVNLKKLWDGTNKVSLYIHIPFCSNKCGYCNLLSTTCFSDERLIFYVKKLIQEIKEYRKILNIQNKNIFSSVILGGGTPTILGIELMRELLACIEKELNVNFEDTFFSIETSPKTISKEYIHLLKKYHINRISIGVQSFENSELLNIYRNEPVENIENALELIFDPENNIEIKNLDLIYGLPNQTIKSWENSLNKLLSYSSEEIFLYPLYVREKTALHKNFKENHLLMEKMYETGRTLLIENGYVQTSMRNFIHKNMISKLYPSHSCQENKMLGLGCGARSYIGNVHYSRKYAVDDKNINKIIDDYLDEENFETADYGYILSADEQKTHYILKSILKITGLDMADYENKFGISPYADFGELKFLINNGFLLEEKSRILLTEKGLKYSDFIGTLFISEDITEKINGFVE